MSVNVPVHLYVMINYIVESLTEAIFPEVKSILRDNDSERFVTVAYCLSQIL